jgi:hypothetical protein
MLNRIHPKKCYSTGQGCPHGIQVKVSKGLLKKRAGGLYETLSPGEDLWKWVFLNTTRAIINSLTF